MRRLFTLLLCITCVLGALAYLIYWHSGWSHINCWTREINIASGHERYTRYWFWRITERKVTPNWVSIALQNPVAPEDQWRTVVTLSPGIRHSPNYSFHSTVGDIKMVEQSFEMFPTPSSVKAQLAANLVWLWQHFDDDYEGGRYPTTNWTRSLHKWSTNTSQARARQYGLVNSRGMTSLVRPSL